MKRLAVLTFSLVFFNTQVLAHPHFDKHPFWDGSVHFGGVLNTGNTDNKQINGALNLSYKKRPWEGRMNLTGEWTRTNHETRAKNAGFEGQLQHYYTDWDFFFGNYKFKWNPFGTYDRVHTGVGGYGRHLIKNDVTELTVQFGPGYRANRVAGAKEHEGEPLFHANGLFSYKFNEETSFNQTVGTEKGSFNTYSKAVSAIRTKMIHNVSLEISYTAEHNTHIPKDSKNRQNLDTSTKISLIYEFM